MTKIGDYELLGVELPHMGRNPDTDTILSVVETIPDLQGPICIDEIAVCEDGTTVCRGHIERPSIQQDVILVFHAHKNGSIWAADPEIRTEIDHETYEWIIQRHVGQHNQPTP